MKKKIFHNWGLKIASLLLAFLIWFLVAKFGDPLVTVTFPNVHVVLKNTEQLEKENKVYEVLDKTDTVRVTVRIPNSMRAQLRASDIVAEADMNKLTEINTIAISYYIPNVEEDSISGDHDVVRLSVEERMTKWIRLQSQIKGEVAENYTVAGTSADQNRIEVSGAKSMIEKISYASVELDVTGATNTISMNVEPQLYDAEGKRLDLAGISRNVDYVHMTVEVLATKEVPVEYTVMGAPAEGYMTTGKTECSQKTVKIAGSPAVLSGVNRILIPEEVIDVSGQSDDVTITLNLKEYLPEGVRLVDSGLGSRVTVTVYIEPRIEKKLKLYARNFNIINVPEGYEARIALEENADPLGEAFYELNVSGLRADINGIRQDDVIGTLDINAWLQEKQIENPKSGIYEIPAEFTLSEKIEQHDEVHVRVTLMKTEDL